MKHLILIICALFISINNSVFAEDKINYPEGYRLWTHVKSLTLHKGHALENPFKGIHHVYANQKALQGLKGKQYKDGATIAFDLLESNTKNHASSEGKRILLGVMVKDNKRFNETGGWGFEAWSKSSRNNRLTRDKGASCFACHTSQRKNDYVFSQWRE